MRSHLNNKTKPLNGNKQTRKLIRRWHRRIGVGISLWLILLAVTGILLNHSDDLSLQKNYVSSRWIIDLYQIKAPANAICFKPDQTNEQVCQIGPQIYQQNKWLINSNQKLLGFYPLADFQLVITQDKVLVYTSNWQLIEDFNQENALPGRIDKLIFSKASKPNTIPLLFIIDNKNWQLDQDLNWQLSKEKELEADIQFKPAIQPTKEHREKLQQAYLSRQISLLHFLQDLHSARIFSKFGKYFTDLVALFIILLTLSGLITWLKRNGKNNS